MKYLTEGLSPSAPLRFFEELTAIPRGSGRESRAADYLAAFAAKRGLNCFRDDFNNVIISKSGRGQPVILQGHTDMVWAWDSHRAPRWGEFNDVNEYFETVGIQLVIDNNTIRASNTTLGADNGVAVAYMLALLDGDLPNLPALECVFTSGEEVGLIGASNLDMSHLRGRRMLNLDSAADGVITAGCAGGCRMKLTRTFDLVPLSDSAVAISVSVSGLQGGHSGTDADKGIKNAICVLADLLCELRKTHKFELARLDGGEADNAIPRAAKAVLVFDSREAFLLAASALTGSSVDTNEIASAVNLPSAGPGAHIAVGTDLADHYLADGVDALKLLCTMPRGVQRKDTVNGFVITSLNCGVSATDGGTVTLTVGLRSSSDSDMRALTATVADGAAAHRFTAQTGASYPGWEFSDKSAVRDALNAAHHELFGRDMSVEVIHAGLECGLFCAELDGLDVAAIGCNVTGLHSPDETLYLDSFERVWRLLIATLQKL